MCKHTEPFSIFLLHKAWDRPKQPPTLPLRLCTRKAMLGDISSRSDSCSESFFFNLSMTLLPLLALWMVGGEKKTKGHAHHSPRLALIYTNTHFQTHSSFSLKEMRIYSDRCQTFHILVCYTPSLSHVYSMRAPFSTWMPGNNHRQIHVSRGAIRHLLLFLPPTEEAIIQAVHQNENNGLCSSLDITDNWAVPQISAEQPVLAGFSMLLSASHLSRDIESVLYVGWNWLFLWCFFCLLPFHAGYHSWSGISWFSWHPVPHQVPVGCWELPRTHPPFGN